MTHHRSYIDLRNNSICRALANTRRKFSWDYPRSHLSRDRKRADFSLEFLLCRKKDSPSLAG